MANRHFSQYLLNKGILTADNVGDVLAECRNVTPDLAVLALEKGLITARQGTELLGVENAAVIALNKKYLSALQMNDLRRESNNQRACLGQVMLDKGLVDLVRLAKVFKDNNGRCCRPIDDLFANLMSEKNLDPVEYTYIKEYLDLLLSTTQRLMHTNALIVLGDSMDVDDTTYFTYQNMGGAQSLSVGCRMTGDVMVAVGSRYSGEELTAVDEMAIDCIEEFCNVLNGLYIVNMSSGSCDMDLDEPKTVRNVVPVGDEVFQLKVETEMGRFFLYLSVNGFIFNDNDNAFGFNFRW